jgi:hypothetical protein
MKNLSLLLFLSTLVFHSPIEARSLVFRVTQDTSIAANEKGVQRGFFKKKNQNPADRMHKLARISSKIVLVSIVIWGIIGILWLFYFKGFVLFLLSYYSLSFALILMLGVMILQIKNKKLWSTKKKSKHSFLFLFTLLMILITGYLGVNMGD